MRKQSTDDERFQELIEEYFEARGEERIKAALGALAREFGQRLLNQALSITANRAVAHELVQEGWIRLSMCRANGGDRPRGLSWMAATYSRIKISELRKRRTSEKNTLAVRRHLEGTRPTQKELDDRAEADAVRDGFGRDYALALSRLTADERRVWMHMHQLAGRATGAEAARLLKMTMAKVYALRTRARLKLSKLLSKYRCLVSACET
jgi:RNA polymerase sigma factor (sigma-70 family)